VKQQHANINEVIQHYSELVLILYHLSTSFRSSQWLFSKIHRY